MRCIDAQSGWRKLWLANMVDLQPELLVDDNYDNVHILMTYDDI